MFKMHNVDRRLDENQLKVKAARACPRGTMVSDINIVQRLLCQHTLFFA
jgi:hypothetical protein